MSPYAHAQFRLLVVSIAYQITYGVLGVMSLLSALVRAEQIHIPVKVQATALEQPSDYFTTLLVMALEASKADNETIDIVFSPHDYSQARWINMLQSD